MRELIDDLLAYSRSTRSPPSWRDRHDRQGEGVIEDLLSRSGRSREVVVNPLPNLRDRTPMKS
jgi:hypothetical protein